MHLKTIFYNLINLFFIFYSKIDAPFMPLESGKINLVDNKYITYFEKQNSSDVLILIELQRLNFSNEFKKLTIRISKNLKEDFLEPPVKVYDNLGNKFIFKPFNNSFSKSEYLYSIFFNTYSSKILDAKQNSSFYEKFIYLEINSIELCQIILNLLNNNNQDFEIFMIYKNKKESVAIKKETLNEIFNKIKSIK